MLTIAGGIILGFLGLGVIRALFGGGSTRIDAWSRGAIEGYVAGSRPPQYPLAPTYHPAADAQRVAAPPPSGPLDLADVYKRQ